MNEGFRTFDHTGDLGLDVWAETPERLHALAGEALMAQVALPAPGPPDATATLSLDGADPEDLFVHWLNTVLLRAELERAVWTRITVTELGPRLIVAKLQGQRLDSGRHERLREVKAISFHGLELDLRPGECRARAILDI